MKKVLSQEVTGKDLAGMGCLAALLLLGYFSFTGIAGCVQGQRKAEARAARQAQVKEAEAQARVLSHQPHMLRSRIDFGMTMDEVVAAIGYPERWDGSEYNGIPRYWYYDSVGGDLTVIFGQGYVSSITQRVKWSDAQSEQGLTLYRLRSIVRGMTTDQVLTAISRPRGWVINEISPDHVAQFWFYDIDPGLASDLTFQVVFVNDRVNYTEYF